MITVYIREVSQEAGYLLGEFKPGEIKALASLFQIYPTHAADKECKFSFAQFVSEEAGAYLEIVVAASEG